MNTGLIWTKDANSYTQKNDLYINLIGSIKSTLCDFDLKSTDAEGVVQSQAHVVVKDATTGEIVELRSLPNGTKDEIRVSEGKLIKRVSDEVVLDGSLNWSNLLTSTNTYHMQITNWQLNKNIAIIGAGAGFVSAKEQNNDLAYRLSTGIDVFDIGVSDFRSIGLAPSNNRLLIRIEKSKIDAMVGATTEEKFKAYLNQYPIALTYQLAEPVISYHPDAEIVCYPGGTISIESEAIDAGESTIPTLIVSPPAGLLLPITIENKEYFEPTYLDQDFILL